MSRYIDIGPYEKDGWYLQKHCHEEYYESVKTMPLIAIPTADPIVRCKDCKWYDEEDLFCRYWAVLYAHADTTPRYSPVDYCFRGMRKDEVKND